MDIGLSVAICGALFTAVAVIYIFKPSGIKKECREKFRDIWKALNDEKEKTDTMNTRVIRLEEQYKYIIKSINEIKNYIKNGKK